MSGFPKFGANCVNKKRAQRILVVDDNQDNVLLMRELLATRGYDVEIAGSAEEAEKRLRTQTPDLILLDVVMPGKSG